MEEPTGPPIFQSNTGSPGIEFTTLLPVIGLSMVMFVVCMTMFGIAVHRGMNRLFAPRSWARPKAVSAMLYLDGVQEDYAILLFIIEVTNAELNQNPKHHNCLQPFISLSTQTDNQKPNLKALWFDMDTMGTQVELF